MKLGSNMAAVDACNVWGDVCQRKCRPPKIGDIPRHSAVEEESLNSSTKCITFSTNPKEAKSNYHVESCAGNILDEEISTDRNYALGLQQETESLEINSSTRVEANPKNWAAEVRQFNPSRAESLTSSTYQSRMSNKIKKLIDTDESDLSKKTEINAASNETRFFPISSLQTTSCKKSANCTHNVRSYNENRANSPSAEIFQNIHSPIRRHRFEFEPGTRIESRIKDLDLISKRMPTTEIQYLKASSVGLEMMNIEKDDDEIKDSKELQKKVEELCLTRREDDLSEKVIGTSGTCLDHEDKLNAGEGREKKEDSTKNIANYNSLASKSSSGSRSLTYAEVLTKTKSSSKFLAHGGPPLANFISSNLSQKSQNVQKQIVHQYSTPNLSSPELESISEKHRDNELDNKTEASDSKRTFPKSIKVYKLLATQSEDRCDGDSHFTDRRKEYQVSRNKKNEASSLSTLEEQKLVHAESVPSLKVPDSPDSGLQYLSATIKSTSSTGKLTSLEEVGTNQRNLADVNPINVRPIYPYCPYSLYGSPQASPTTRRRPLRESRRVSIDNRQGALQLNQYKLLDNIGQGSYGIVKLVFNEGDETHYAMKILSKKKLMKKAGIFGRMAPGRKGSLNPLAKVYREIALLKKLDHPNVVKLLEVLDDPDEDNLYLVFELVEKGEVLQVPTDKPIDEETSRKNFRDVILGLEYLHYQKIVHRDIKPSNLLVDGEGHVKIADLGVSAELRTSGELLTGSAGTPAFAAPETTTPGAQYSGTPCDIWSLGVTLYSLLTGRLPWDGAGSIIGVQAAVRTEPLRFPETLDLSDDSRDLISLMLTKNPNERIKLSEIKEHRWLTKNGTESLPSEADNCRLQVTVTDEEVASVVTRVPKLDTLILIKTMLKQHSFQNPFLTKKPIKSTVNDVTSKNSEISKETHCSILQPIESMGKSQQFHESGRSNSAPDSFDWQGIGRQASIENLLPSVTEASFQETEVGKR